MERDLQSLLDMLQSAQIVMNYIAGRSQAELTTDQQLQDAMIHRLLIIGEASKLGIPTSEPGASSSEHDTSSSELR